MLSHDNGGGEDDRSVRLFGDEVASVLGIADLAESDPASSVEFDEFWAGGHVSSVSVQAVCGGGAYGC